MYVSQPSREERVPVLMAAVHDIQLCALVAASPEGLLASHLPMLLREGSDGAYFLEGHVARPNELWKAARAASSGLAIFQGPQAYVHPGWYPTKHLTGRAVPTWNYIAVHLHGPLEAIENEDWLRRHLTDLTARNEGDRPEPWAMSDAPADYIAGMLRGIVGIRMSVDRFEGNWKMAQRQPFENRMGAMEGLAASPRPGDKEVAAIMRTLHSEEGLG